MTIILKQEKEGCNDARQRIYFEFRVHSMSANTKVENVEAMVAAAQEFGVYQGKMLNY